MQRAPWRLSNNYNKLHIRYLTSNQVVGSSNLAYRSCGLCFGGVISGVDFSRQFTNVRNSTARGSLSIPPLATTLPKLVVDAPWAGRGPLLVQGFATVDGREHWRQEIADRSQDLGKCIRPRER